MIRLSICTVVGAVAISATVMPVAAQTVASYSRAVAAPAPPPAAPVTRALLPGHWQLSGAKYVWVPPETTPRVVQGRPFFLGENVWKNGQWVFVPAHYAPPY